MPRRRVAVALIPPPVLADRIDTLRRALGVPEPFPVPAHVTLVPPVNVRAEDSAVVVAALRAAAVDTEPFALRVGPAATFAPDSPTLHLAVAPHGGGELAELRRRVRQGPLDRPDTWPFVPHVTLAESYPPERIADAVTVLGGVDEPWTVEALHLLEEQRHDDGTRFWRPVREEPLGPPAVVGRGGVELVLRTLAMVDAEVAAVCRCPPGGPALAAGAAAPLVVAAEPGPAPDPAVGPVVGAVVGATGADGVARLEALAVVPDRRGEGVGRQLLTAWCSAAARRGCTLVLADDPDALPVDLLSGLGFVPAAGALVRSLR